MHCNILARAASNRASRFGGACLELMSQSRRMSNAMCGRFTQAYSWDEVNAFLDLAGPARNLQAHYNITPSGEPLANSINIMQDYITRARLAGKPPHVMLVPRLRHIGLMEFNRAKEAIAEGRLCVEQALPVIKLFV